MGTGMEAASEAARPACGACPAPAACPAPGGYPVPDAAAYVADPRSLMSVCTNKTPSCFCDPVQNCICHAFARTFVYAAAGLIVSAKPSAIFNFGITGRDLACVPGVYTAQALESKCARIIRLYKKELHPHGLDLATVGQRNGRMFILAWRTDLLQEILDVPANRSFLQARGYQAGSPRELVRLFEYRLRSFYRAQTPGQIRFPHEIGLILGYPLEDVIGFVEGRPQTCWGPWKAYGDVTEAQRRFDKIRSCEFWCRDRFAKGESLGQLIARPPRQPLDLTAASTLSASSASSVPTGTGG